MNELSSKASLTRGVHRWIYHRAKNYNGQKKTEKNVGTIPQCSMRPLFPPGPTPYPAPHEPYPIAPTGGEFRRGGGVGQPPKGIAVDEEHGGVVSDRH